MMELLRLSREKKFWLLQHLGLPVALGIYRMVSLTWKLDPRAEDYKKTILSTDRAMVLTYHGDLLALLPFAHDFMNRGRQVAVLASPSRDGRIGIEVIHRLGARAVVGSTSSRAEASAREMTKELARGSIAFITTDGPRGPRGSVRLGTLRMARLTGARIFLAAASSGSAKVFGSWDRIFLPKPFTRITVEVEPFEFEENESDEEAVKRLHRKIMSMHEALNSPLLDGTEKAPE